MEVSQIQASDFSMAAGNPICRYLQQSSGLLQNKSLSRVWMLSGDPATYGSKDICMPEEGYEEVRKAIRDKDNHGYINSIGTEAARRAIIKHFGGGRDQHLSDVIITSGVNMGLLYCLQAICNPGDNIIVPEAGYPFFEGPAAGRGVKVKHYRLVKECNFEIDLEHLETLVDQKTRFVFIINPSNPMGSVFSKKHLLNLIKLAQQQKFLIVADQVYHGMSFEKGGFHSIGHLTEEAPVITLCGVEKLYCVPGWATGWLMIYDPKGHLKQVKGCLHTVASFFIHSNTFIQKALPHLLDVLDGPNFVQKFMPLYKKNHDYIVQRLKYSKWLKAYKAQGTFYLTVELKLDALNGFLSDVQVVRALIEQQNVNLVPLSVMGNMCGFRILTFCSDSLYNELFERLDKFFVAHGKQE